MRELKAKLEEEAHLQRIKQCIGGIHHQAVAFAQRGDSSFNFPIPFDMSPRPKKTIQVAQAPQKMIVSKKEALFDAQMSSYQAAQAAAAGRPSDPFYIENMPDILSGLQELFPGCTISHSIMCQGTDGKLYDISTLDEKVLPFVNRALYQSFIVIDWS
jgi:hypothetical protein